MDTKTVHRQPEVPLRGIDCFKVLKKIFLLYPFFKTLTISLDFRCNHKLHLKYYYDQVIEFVYLQFSGNWRLDLLCARILANFRPLSKPPDAPAASWFPNGWDSQGANIASR